ncbi:MAG TPA: GTPase HflX [Bacilli bacterium]|nr:MAG: GTPase HflX [Tenericutes bacterium ADurb.BinA124]HNZ50455.1 GTPase HflX [Bacilli bacterium]HPX83789.1 GTPase HflX [Bacilli bacterium]HQC73908.1 GTPase HflX [Bacilli bacterium]
MNLEKKNRILIVGVNTNPTSPVYHEEIAELVNLCEACDLEVIDTITQNLEQINPQTYLGKGKLDEIAELIRELQIDVLVFNDELKPLMIAKIQAIVNCELYDRTYIILEIFRRRAKTKEALLQVEIATLRYRLPQLIGLRSYMARQRGTGSLSHGRGIGETKLELDKRMIYKRIATAKKELNALTSLRKQQRQKRQKQQMKIVALVGYTNSGKSSTLNALLKQSVAIKKEVTEKDMLFTTLETATRLIKTKHNLQFLVTDTVGFISKLPHQLIEAFKSTLEEITEADLIVHVVDGSNPQFEKQIEVTNTVLSEIGVSNIPMIYAFNKSDLHSDYFYVPFKYEKALRISAIKNTNIDCLIALIEEQLFKTNLIVDYKIPFNEGQMMNYLHENAIILETKQNENDYFIKAKVSPLVLEKMKPYEK